MKLTRFERATCRSAICCSIQLSHSFNFFQYGAGGIRLPALNILFRASRPPSCSSVHPVPGFFLARLTPWHSYRSTLFRIPQVFPVCKYYSPSRGLIGIYLPIIRSRRDSNPRYPCEVQLLSREPDSASLAPLQDKTFFQGLRLGIFTGALRFESLNVPLFDNFSQNREI